ncbi:SCO family protein [Halovenus rubra]|uniref:SCO family protein n=2 Tax=Halovenus rubra TaxID=869890 RepID=A0ACC7DZ57_9EURY|nr:SCO family protein [Halovenus rubra]
MDRRTFVRLAAVSAGGAVAGCIGGEDSNTVFDEPYIEDANPEALAYPAHGEKLPDVSLPAPLQDKNMSTAAFVGERETLLTFIYTRCPGPCPGMTAALAHVHVDAAKEGYSDEVALMPTTFDPEYDDTERLRKFSKQNGADPTAENWVILRPESSERADEVINGEFGVGFEAYEKADGKGHGGHNSSQGEPLNPDEGDTDFTHVNLVLLANRDGYIERAYQEVPRPDKLLSDLKTVRNGY